MSKRTGEHTDASREVSIQRGRRGAAGVVLLVLGLLCLGLVAAWVFLRRGAPASAAPAPAPAHTHAPGPNLPSPDAPVLTVGRGPVEPDRPIAPFDPARLDGRGVVRGAVVTDPELPFPVEWTLSVGPSPSLFGAERAETRELVFTEGEQEFVLEDLPLGGYQLRAQSFGLDSGPFQLMLSLPHEADTYVTLRMQPTGIIEGRVRDAAGRGCEDLSLTLEERTSGARREVRTAGGGTFLIDDVRDGLYRLHVGGPDSPLVAARELEFKRPSLHLGDIEVPVTSALVVRVEDASGRPVSDATLSGYGNNGGSVQGTTDADGACRIAYLIPGRITVMAQTQDGRFARERAELDGGVEGALTLVLEQ